MAFSSTRPNILFVFADDWGWGDLGCYGHRHVRTPHLDQLAAEGTLFSQFYVCSGVCSPSRAAVMTGRFPARFGIHGHFATHERNADRGMPNWLDPSATTVTRLFQQAGFRVGHFGKWHLGNGAGAPAPTAYGIDVFDEPSCPIVYSDPSHTGTRATSSREIVDQAIGFLEQRRGGTGAAADPFFLNVWLYDTHASLDPSEEQLERYVDYMPLHVPHAGATAIYYSTVTEADLQIGRLLAKLDELGLADDTIVIFSADNGPEDMEIRNSAHSGVGSAGPFRGRKRSLYEGGVRVPFILRWPGTTPAGVVNDDTPLCAVDLLPTFCELAGVDVPSAAGLDGESMAAAFRGEQRPRSTPLLWKWRFHIFGHVLHRSPMLAIRDGEWKLLRNPDGDRVELYRIPDDPSELNNRADAEPEVVQRLGARAHKWQASLPAGPVSPDAGSNAYPWPGTNHREDALFS